MGHSILARLREYVGDRRRAPRRGARFYVSVPAVVTPLERGADAGAGGLPSVEGVTRDLGAEGLTLLLGAMRAGGLYLTDNECHLGVRLRLPRGEVFLLARVVRFEQPEREGEGYLLGARIVGAREGDRAAYHEFLLGLAPSERRSGERARVRSEMSAAGGGQQQWGEAETAAELRAAFERFTGMGARGGGA